MIKKSCTIVSVVLLAVFAGYFKLLYGRIELFPAILLAGFGALGLADARLAAEGGDLRHRGLGAR